MNRKRNKLLAGFLAFLLLLSVIPATVSVSAQEADLTIGTLAELQAFAKAVNGGNTYEGKTVTLSADIMLGGESNPWTAIGTSANSFKGTFDGNNHVISGLYIASGSSVGFFGDVNGGTVKNLIVRGEVNGTSNVAGIVGKLTAGKVTDCGNEATVSGGTNVGGVVGSVNGDCTISGCYNKGNVTGTTGYIGGVTGQHWRAGVVENCYNAGTVTGPATVGGVSGGHKAASPELKNCYNAGTVKDAAGNNNNIGAVIGATRGTNTNCYYLSGTGADSKGTEVETLSAELLGDAFKEDTEGLNDGHPVLTWQKRLPDLIIGSYEALKSFADSVSAGETYEGALIRLDVNIYLGGESNPWTAIGTSANSFRGTFDGNNHVISGLYIASGSSVGFFGDVNGGTVKNLIVRGEVNGTSNVAGIVGKLTAGKVTDCGNEATVSGGTNVGGVVGSVNGDCTISGCYNKGNVTGTTGYIGGVTGQHWRAGVVENCYNAGTVTGPATVGGVSGGHKAASPELKNCYNAGTVKDAAGNNNNIGAVIGATRGTNTNCYYLSGTGADSKGTEVETLSAELLGDAFTDGETLPCLKWESSVSTDTPVRPAFVEGTELSAQLAAYIKAAVNSAKAKNSVSGTLLGNEGFLSGASSTATDWMALAMGRFGYWDNGTYTYLIDDGTGYGDYLAAMRAYIEKTYAENAGILHSAKATEWHRAVVAIAALGGDPTDFGIYQGNPINLIADGSYNNMLKAGPGTQGINGWIWGLIAMDTGMYPVPADAKYTRETFITEILKMQLTDGVQGNAYGGWVLGGYGSRSDVDITAMAIQALAPYYNDDTVYTYVNENSKTEVSKTVRQCIDEALDLLGTMQNQNGGFASWGTDNVESVAQVVVALCAVGIDPAKDERFITRDGKTLLDGMLQFLLPDGGFCHTANGGWNSMANDQATYALVSYWRFENGMRTLYDMRQDPSAETTDAIRAVSAAIEAANDPASSGYKAQLKTALELFRAVPQAERRYVRNYSALASAIALVGGEQALDTDTPYITAISVTKKPDKVRYYAGEVFDPAGMEVTALYSDGHSEALSGYKLSASGELALGDDTVYVMYGVLKIALTIEVRERMPWKGEGTADDPYLIETADDLADLRYYCYFKKMQTTGVYFRMTQDINMKNIADWQAIADSTTGGFCGHFDGSGYAVWNLNSHTYNVCGLFGRLGDGAVIENLTIAGGNLGGAYNNSIGGIAGEVVSGATVTVRNCHNYATLTGLWGIGGIIGEVEDGATVFFENCSNHGMINARYTGAGIVGQVGPNRWKENGAKAVVQNCYNAGTVGGDGNWGLGGIVGSFRLGGEGQVIRNCYNIGTVRALPTAGAVFGSIAEAAVTVENVYYLSETNPLMNGVFTDDGSDTVGTVTGTAVAMDASDMKNADFVSRLGNAFVKDADAINGGYPVLAGQKPLGEEPAVRARVEIGTAEELKAFADRVNAGESFTDKTVLLINHIDLSDFQNWTQIGRSSSVQFDGIFDGQGYVIDNLYSTTGGLFGYVGTNAVIKNVGVASGEIGSDNISWMGGIARWSNGADFINCWNGADIICNGWSGGIVGTVRDGGDSIIKGCYNVGSVTARDGAVGGIVGHLATGSNGTSVHVIVSECYNAGAVTAKDNAGGIVGRAQDGHVIRNCYNVGKVSVTGDNILDGAGGIASLVTSDNEIINCYYHSETTTYGVSNGNDTTVGKTAEELQADAMLQLLGDGFKQDRYALVNHGYPLLHWQKTEDADAVDAVADRIAAVGTVTADSADAIRAARAAYDALSDELKALVNVSVLEAAERELDGILQLAQAKEDALRELDAYKNPSDYRAEQAEELERLHSAGQEAVRAAETIEAVKAALAAAKADMDAVKTDRQLSDEEAVRSVSEAIAAIGAVTLDREDAIRAARAAYDALSDALKERIENYVVLTAAEEALAALREAETTTGADTEEPDTEEETSSAQESTSDADTSDTTDTSGSAESTDGQETTGEANADGCGSSVSLGFWFVAILGIAVMIVDRKRKHNA